MIRFYAAGVAAACAVVAAGVALNLAGNRFEALQPMFTKVKITVPDHNIGENPVVMFERTASERINALWSSSIQYSATDETISDCSSTENVDYVGARGAGDPATYSLYRPSMACRLSPGRYYLHSCWRPASLVYGGLCARSNDFTVSP